MKKLRQIAAVIGIILLAALYGSTMVFALMKNPASKNLLMASVYCTIAVPVLLYAMALVARNLRKKGDSLRQEEENREKQDTK